VLYEFAITPDVFNRADFDAQPEIGVILVELLRGLRDNGLVANLHKDRWGVHVSTDMLPQLPLGLRDKLNTCLALLRDRHRLIRHPASADGNPATDLDWLNLALVSHARIPLRGIVLSQNLQVAYLRSSWLRSPLVILGLALFLAAPAFAQGTSPWENAVSVLQQAFTSTIARGLSLVAIVVAGLTFAFGEGGSKRVLAGVLFGVGMAIAAVNFLSWLFPGN
jgi:type IV secretory pathway VirB2 component (pilin)